MNCPECGAWSSVKETRSDKTKTKYRRRRECGNGHKFTTEEKVVIRRVGPVQKGKPQASGETAHPAIEKTSTTGKL